MRPGLAGKGQKLKKMKMTIAIMGGACTVGQIVVSAIENIVRGVTTEDGQSWIQIETQQHKEACTN